MWYCVTTDASLLSASGAASSTLTVGPGWTISRHTVVQHPVYVRRGLAGGETGTMLCIAPAIEHSMVVLLLCGGNLAVIVLNGCMWKYFVMDIVVEIFKAPEVVLLLVAR